MPIARDYRVLLASSDAATRLELALALVPNYELVEASEGADVLVKLGTCRPDIAVIDTDVGGLDGFDVCRAIRQDSEFGTMPVFLLSRLDSRADFKRGYDAGATLYMVKPVDAPRLLKNIGLTIQSEQIFARPGRTEIVALRARGVPATPRGGRPVPLDSIPVMSPDAPPAATGGPVAAPDDPHERRAAGRGGASASDAGLDRFLGRKGRAFLEPKPGTGSLDQLLAGEGVSERRSAPQTGFDFLDDPAPAASEVKTGFDFLDEIEAPTPSMVPPRLDSPAPVGKSAPDLDFLDDLDAPAAFAGLDDLDVPENAGVVHARESVPRAPTPPPYRPSAEPRAPLAERRSREGASVTGSGIAGGRPPRPGTGTGTEAPREERRRWAERPAASTGDHPDLSFLDEPDSPRAAPARPGPPVRTDPFVGEKEVDLSFLDAPDEVVPAPAPSPEEAPKTPPRIVGAPTAAETLRSTHRARERDRPITVADIMGLDGLDLERAAAPESPPSLTAALGIPDSTSRTDTGFEADLDTASRERARSSGAARPEVRISTPAPASPAPARPHEPGPLPSLSPAAMASVDLDDILGFSSPGAGSKEPRTPSAFKTPARESDAMESAPPAPVPAPPVEPAPPGTSSSRVSSVQEEVRAPKLEGGSAIQAMRAPEPSAPEPSVASRSEPAPPDPAPPIPPDRSEPEPEPARASPLSKLPPPPLPGGVGPDGKKKSLNLRQLLGEPGKGGKPGLPPPPQARPRPAGAPAPGAPPASRPSSVDSKILGLGTPGGDSAPDA